MHQSPARPLLRFFLLLGCLLALHCRALAIPLDRSFGQLEHRSWSAKDGAPPSIISMAQTDDGYLWLGTAGGLYWFDGMRFQLFQPRKGTIADGFVYFIKAQPGVGLWVGWRQGGISLIRDGEVTNFGEEQGVAAGSWWGFAFDRQGTVFATGLGGVLRFDGRRWHSLGPQQGYTAQKASAVFVDRGGNLGVFSDRGLFILPPGAARFQPPIGKLDLRQPPQLGPDGRIYVIEARGVRVIDRLERYDQLDHGWLMEYSADQGLSMLVDRAGSLWYETLGAGVHRRHPEDGALEVYSAKDGLSANLVYFLFEDRDGNVWIATANGLDRFRQVDVNRFTPRIAGFAAVEASLLAGPGDSMTLTSANASANWLTVKPDGAVLQALSASQAGFGRAQLTLRGRDDTVWLATAVGLRQRSARGDLRTIAYPPDMGPVRRVRALALGADDSLWMAVVGAGVYHWRDQRWQREPLLPDGGALAPLSLLSDAAGRIWFGYAKNRVVMLDHGKIVDYGSGQGLQVGAVSTLHAANGQLWAGGENGLARYHDGRFEPWRFGAANMRNISAMLFDANGNLWLNAIGGTLRVAAADVAKAIADPSYVLPGRLFGALDGRLGVTDLTAAQSLAIAGDGKVWLSTHNGVAWIDPARLIKVAAPPVTVQTLSAGQQVFQRPREVTLAAGADHVQIDYGSAALGAAEQLGFRYRLDGYDQDWQAAGARRQAFYTGLPPGQYHFRAVAQAPDGSLSEEGAGLRFTILPAYYQTWWFRCLLALLAVGLCWALYRMRLRQLEHRIRAQVEVRHAERERIARALHDTILQSVQALILKFDGIKRALAADHPAQRQIELALCAAQEVVDEGRDEVMDLRAERYSGMLGDYLEESGRKIAEQHGMRFSLRVAGPYRPLAAPVTGEVLAIAREAMLNAGRHAGGAELEVELDYAADSLRLLVRDHGRGIDDAVLALGERPGHWGLGGMRERAERLHGSLRIDSEAGVGTTVSLTMASEYAFERQR